MKGRNRFHGLATRLGLGPLALHFWHHPRGYLRQIVLEGGPVQQARTRRGREAMARAAATLPELRPPSGSYDVSPRFLTGARFWDQTLFCIASLQMHSSRRVEPIVFDDGTLNDRCMDAIRRVIPWARFRRAKDIEEELDQRLPANRYPGLRARRLQYPHLRKLTDLHDHDEWSLILDSDMLFFRPPVELLDWMSAPEGIVHMQDAKRSYGYSDALLIELSRGVIPDRMNVGLYGLHGSEVDFDYLEYCVVRQLDREGPNYLQEQALTALLVSGRIPLALNPRSYLVLPVGEEGRNPSAILHHYVAESKRYYFQNGWRSVEAQLKSVSNSASAYRS